MNAQASRLDHVLFAGATHEPAVRLAERLVAVAPRGLSRVFYSDDGSTAVEVALKLVLQAWVQRGFPERRVFVALEGAYHGDTFGAMSVGDPDPFFLALQPLFFEVLRVPLIPEAIESALVALGPRAAGLILEPLLQGAAGMRIQSEDFVRAARAACDVHGVPLIADEVFTGFGRTGALFACERAGISPDVLCLAKGLTGGTLPLAATLVREELFQAFVDRDRSKFFPHGHTFTANPIACAVALASLDLVEEDDTPARLARIGQSLFTQLASLRELPQVCDVRAIGGMAAVELRVPEGSTSGYMSALAPRMRAEALQKGVLLRPLGNVLYALPPACVDDEQVEQIARTMCALVRGAP